MRYAVVLAALIVPALQAAEIRVLAGSALQPVAVEVIPGFERESGHRVAFDWAAVGEMAQRAKQGEQADAVIVSAPQMDQLVRDGRVVGATRRDLGRTGIGVFVRKGAPRPDISSEQAFRRAMLEAKSIGYNDPSAGAPVSIYLRSLFERMGLAAQMAPKTVVFTKRSDRFEAVARGDVEIGFNQVSEIVAQPSVDLVGPLPAPIQNYTTLSIGVLSNAANPEGARRLADFLTSAEVTTVMTRKGFERP